jgi:hypothetical protein
MSDDDLAEWWKRIERAQARVKGREEKWDILLKEYLPIVSKSGEAETVKVQAHFRNVHTKMGQLFYRSPDLILTPDDPGPANNLLQNPQQPTMPGQPMPGQPPMPGAPPPPPPGPPLTMEDIISIKQAVLNKTLGRDGIKTIRLMDELLFDVLGWSGIGCSKLGYRCVTKPVPAASSPGAPPNPVGASATGVDQGPAAAPPPAFPGAAPPIQAQPVPVPIFEEWYWRRFSPKKALWNDDLRSTRFDEDATWLGMEFFMSPGKAMKAFNLTADEAAKAAEDDRVHVYEEDKHGGSPAPGLVHGYELWPKASVFTDEPHPQAIRQLVLIEGIRDRPIVWRLSPDQEFDPTTGKLTEDSLIGFPIRILTIRDLADSAFPESDSAFTNSEVKQLSTWRRQSVKLRDAQIGKYLYDTGQLDDDDLARIQAGDVGDWIGLKAGALAQGADKVVSAMQQIHATNDDYRGYQGIETDMNETLGISANQAGSPTPTVRTATEVSDVQTNASARSEKERSRVVDFYLDGARMIDQLLMRYADNTQYVHIAGDDGARRLQAWNGQMISGKFLYEISPDSQMAVDTEADFQLLLNFYNLSAQDPMVNRQYLVRRLARMRGLDPAKVILPPQPPAPPKPVPPSISFAFKGEDLLNPTVLAILRSAEVLPPEPGPAGETPPPPPPATQMGQPPHGGTNPHGATLSQHLDSNSGKMPNEPGAPNKRQTQVK